MKVPLSWLRDYVDITTPVEELAERMTLAGLEVAAIEYIGLPEPEREGVEPPKRSRRRRLPWDRDKILVGEIIEVRPHPNADRLTIAVVDYGAEEPVAVVTGAPNVPVGASGLKAPFAKIGARLIDGHADELRYMTLKPTKIRGVRSEGMVCSEKELGISDDHEGIMLLPDEAPLGMPLADYMGDIILDLDLTPNLARCLSIIGIAREVAALTGKKISLEVPHMEATSDPIAGQIELEIADPDLCSRYSATLIKEVKIGPSPRWMQRRLTLAGMRPINNIVDTTNYVMLEWGQPLHAFDYDKLRNRAGVIPSKPDDPPPIIIVRRARAGESITTLDGVHRHLSEDMLLITDGGGPVAIAGVMGGFESEVSEETTNILLESANFNNISNRRTSQTLKLPSEASLRFSRGLPAELTVPAVTRASELMRQLAGGTIAAGIADAYPVKQEKRVVEITAAEVKRIVGPAISADEIVRILEALEFECAREDEAIKATVPDHRIDVEIPADIIEEVARVYGYDRIPCTLMGDDLPPQRRNVDLEGEERVRDILVGCGLDEVITYSLTSLDTVAKLTPGEVKIAEEEYIRLANPLTPEREYMRRTLMASLLETMRDNFRYCDRVTIFEIGHVYLPVKNQQLPEEPRRLGIALSGPRLERSWTTASAEGMDFYDLKGVVESLLAHLGVEEPIFEPVQHSTFHPARTALLRVAGVEIGIMGEVHPLVREAFDLPAQRACLAEFDLDALLGQAEYVRTMQPVSRFPPVTQDLAIVVDEEVPARQVQEVITKAGGNLLARVTLFDLYRGEQIEAGKKSLAYSLSFQAEDRTLTDEEVGRLQARIVKQLERRLRAHLRG